MAKVKTTCQIETYDEPAKVKNQPPDLTAGEFNRGE
jgi:hypothetical protein